MKRSQQQPIQKKIVSVLPKKQVKQEDPEEEKPENIRPRFDLERASKWIDMMMPKKITPYKFYGSELEPLMGQYDFDISMLPIEESVGENGLRLNPLHESTLK